MTPNELLTRAQNLLRNEHGALSEELSRTQAGFGVGQVLKRLKPDATTTLVCGYCSTGCGLEAHLQGGRAVNLSPAFDYSVNLGMACPKGWEALTPLEAKDRATTPLVRNKRGKLEPTDCSIT